MTSNFKEIQLAAKTVKADSPFRKPDINLKNVSGPAYLILNVRNLNKSDAVVKVKVAGNSKEVGKLYKKEPGDYKWYTQIVGIKGGILSADYKANTIIIETQGLDEHFFIKDAFLNYRS